MVEQLYRDAFIEAKLAQTARFMLGKAVPIHRHDTSPLAQRKLIERHALRNPGLQNLTMICK